MIERYVLFVTRSGSQKATRRMSRLAYSAMHLIMNLLAFAIGFCCALAYAAKMK